MKNLVELFSHVDDCCMVFRPILEGHMLTSGIKKRRRARSLSVQLINASGHIH